VIRFGVIHCSADALLSSITVICCVIVMIGEWVCNEHVPIVSITANKRKLGRKLLFRRFHYQNHGLQLLVIIGKQIEWME